MEYYKYYTLKWNDHSPVFSLVAISVIICLWYVMSFDIQYALHFSKNSHFLFKAMLLTSCFNSDPDQGHMKKLLMQCTICGNSAFLKSNCWVFISVSLISEFQSISGLTSTNSRCFESMTVHKKTVKMLLLHLAFISNKSIDEIDVQDQKESSVNESKQLCWWQNDHIIIQ